MKITNKQAIKLYHTCRKTPPLQGGDIRHT